MRKLLAVMALVFITLCGTARAADDRDRAVGLVKEAIAFYKANGLEKTLDFYNQPSKDPLYVFIYDMNIVLLANPYNSAIVGQHLKDVPDADGKFFRREILTHVNEKGSGWTDYRYRNPKSKELERKTTFCEKADDLIFCCGIYKK